MNLKCYALFCNVLLDPNKKEVRLTTSINSFKKIMQDINRAANHEGTWKLHISKPLNTSARRQLQGKVLVSVPCLLALRSHCLLYETKYWTKLFASFDPSGHF